MSHTDPRHAERRRAMRLAPLMVAVNAFLFLCMLGLGIGGLRGERVATVSPAGDAPQRIVRDYLAQRVPAHRYRIREWLPATPLSPHPVAAAGHLAEPPAERGVAQRVKLVFYGPTGARQLDTVYWVENGQVTRRMEADSAPPTQHL